jgi:DHA3 family multidrug efflux protein-like MFS transporter
MKAGADVDLIDSWFGTGTDRGLALLFTVAGLIGLAVTLLAMRSNSYRSLSQLYKNRDAEQELPGAYPDPA